MIINIHSFIDLITNSSTEMFVLDTDKSIELVKDILQSAIDLHNKVNNTKYKFRDIFQEPYFGSGILAVEGWGYKDYYTSRIEKGIILIGADDNSIPYWMFDFIQDVFGYKTEKFHLG